MTISEAKREFAIRYYLWAKSEFESEIRNAFPSFRAFKTGAAWKTYQFMQLLSPKEQELLANALLKRFHKDATDNLEAHITHDESAIRQRRDNFFQIKALYNSVLYLQQNSMPEQAIVHFGNIRDDLAFVLGESSWIDDELLFSRANSTFNKIPKTFEEEIAEKKKAGQKVRFASKRKIRKAIKAMIEKSFTDQITKLDTHEDDEDISFQIQSCGWTLVTNFRFGRQASLLEYCTGIYCDSRTDPEIGEIKTNVLKIMISFNSWLGLSNQTEWEYLSDSEIEPACESTISFLSKFFNVAPKLLKGLESDKIQPE